MGDISAAGNLGYNPAGLSGVATLGGVMASGSLVSGVLAPSWLAGAAVNEWVAVPNSTWRGSAGESSDLPTGFGNKNGVVNAENGSAFDRRSNEIFQFGGGHLDWAGNELISIVLTAETPTWVLRRDHSAQVDIPSIDVSPDLSHYYDGRPASRHTYQGTHFIESLNKYMAVGGYPWSHANGNLLEPVTFDITAGDWDAAGTWNKSFSPNPAAGNGIFAKHPITEDIYFAVGGGYYFYKLNILTKAWTTISGSITGYFPGFECHPIDPTRNALFVMSTRGDASVANYMCALFSLTTGARTNITINPSSALTLFQSLSTNHGGCIYNEHQDCFYWYFGGTGMGGRIFKITPNGTTTWDITELTMTGATVPAGVGVALGNTLSRFGYAPSMRAVYAFPSATSPIYMAKVE